MGGGFVTTLPWTAGRLGSLSTWYLILRAGLGLLTDWSQRPEGTSAALAVSSRCLCHVFLLSYHLKQVPWPNPEPGREQVPKGRGTGRLQQSITVPQSRVFIVVH